MKKTIISLCVVMLAIACSKSPQQLAEKSITGYLKENLLHPGDYKPISFDTLKTFTEADTLNRVLEFAKWKIGYTTDSAGVLATIALCEERLALPGVNTRVALYAVNHKYKHIGIDNQPVELSVDFFTDTAFHVVNTNFGIQGQAFFDVLIVTQPWEYSRIEKYAIDGVEYPIGTVKQKVPYGDHKITWWVAQKLLMENYYLTAVPYDQNFSLREGRNDTVPGIAIFVIRDQFMHAYNSREEFLKSGDVINEKID